MYVCTETCVNVSVFVKVCLYVCMYVSTETCVNVSVFVRVCLYVCMTLIPV